MTRSDTRLTDPDAATVHDAIEAAFRAVNARGIAVRIAHTKISLKRLANRTVAEPEGVEFWASRTTVATGIAGQVLVAWWTAISGRRHVRVVGHIVTPETGYLVNSLKMNTRPPVWHVFPDRVYRRRAGKANDLVAVCGCGAVGTEKALGWAGSCCGPCIDFQEEHGALPPQRPALLPMPEACRAVAGSADGRWVAGACAGRVVLWDLDAGTKLVDTSAYTGIAPQLAISPTGDYFAIADGTEVLRVFDLRNDRTQVVAQFAGVEAVTFHPVENAMYTISGRRAKVSAPPEARPRDLANSQVEGAGPLVFNRDGTRLAVQSGQQVRVHDAGGNMLASIRFPRADPHRTMPVVPRPGRVLAPQVAFSPDGGQIAVGYARALAVHHAVTGEQRFHDGVLPDEVTGAAFDPSGKWLFVGRRDGSLVAYRTDVISDDRSVVFRWSLGPIYALARCGESLLTACDEGVQVWPMAKLLEGV